MAHVAGHEVGRISGPLLKSNLQRTSDLAFETDLLYIAHTNGKIGIKNDAPAFELNKLPKSNAFPSVAIVE